MKNATHISRLAVTLAAATALAATHLLANSGAIWTTDAQGTVNQNIFADKTEVYLNGGPQNNSGGDAYPDGVYYAQITTPDGTVLGTSVGHPVSETPITVSNGRFVESYHLWSILIKASDGSQGYDDTTNEGGVYKVWVSSSPSFANNRSKTDNFIIRRDSSSPSAIEVIKFYDANANGLNDDYQLITDWKVSIVDANDSDVEWIRYTPALLEVAPGAYVVSEFHPVETSWLNTTPDSVTVDVAAGETEQVEFGNLCLGAGGGRTLGFWSNKNGQALVGSDDLALLRTLNLRDGAGKHFDPSGYAAFRTWLLGAKAVNMANMLSAQLAAMALNIHNGLVDGAALIHAPGTQSANALGFAAVGDVVFEANASLAQFGSTLTGHAQRAYQEALKNALDNANNNLTFVQPSRARSRLLNDSWRSLADNEAVPCAPPPFFAHQLFPHPATSVIPDGHPALCAHTWCAIVSRVEHYGLVPVNPCGSRRKRLSTTLTVEG